MADREDGESLAGLTQNTFLKAPLEPCFDLFSGLFEGNSNRGECSNNTSNNITTYSDHVLMAEKELNEALRGIVCQNGPATFDAIFFWLHKMLITSLMYPDSCSKSHFLKIILFLFTLKCIRHGQESKMVLMIKTDI